MTYEQMIRKINTAGTWFTGVFMGELLRNYSNFKDSTDLKVEFIKYMHKEYGESLNYTFESTKTKCYALISIIEGARVIDALDHVLQSNENKVPEEAREGANLLLDEIALGKITLPY